MIEHDLRLIIDNFRSLFNYDIQLQYEKSH